MRVLGFDENFLLLGFFVLAILFVLLRSARLRRGGETRAERSWIGDSSDAGDGGGD